MASRDRFQSARDLVRGTSFICRKFLPALKFGGCRQDWGISMVGNLEYYKVFYYAAKNGSVTGAAAELSLSQPAVSQALKQLESALSVKLFVRVPRGIRLTTEGQALYTYVKAGYEQIMSGERKLASMLQLDYGELKIGASDMTLKYYLLPLLQAYHERFPGIKVTVTNAPTPETLRLLRKGEIEFGVVSTPFADKSKLHVIPVREIEDVFVAGRKFMQYKNHMLDLQELEKLPIICLEGSTSTKSYMDEFLKQNGVELHPEFELATSDMIVQFALRNLGVGSVVRDFAGEYLEDGRLFELRFNQMIPKRKICVVADAQGPASRAAEEFLKMVPAPEFAG